jgi:dipeptidyl aminopeptidase/acylaminoacyl peptidase
MEFFSNPFYNFESLRAVCSNIYSTPDEIKKITNSITEGDEESWYQHWYAAALNAFDQGVFFKASNYFRTAVFMFADDQERTLLALDKSREVFQQAISHEPYSIRHIQIPYEGTTLPGYLCLVDNSDKKRPTVLLQSGFDGTGEEVYITTGKYALEHGYNVLIFEGPGQGAARRKRSLIFRPDWESVVTPIVDFAFTIPQIDTKNLVLYGISMGGYLAPRALAYEHRIAIGIANGGVYDFHNLFMRTSPAELELMLDVPEYEAHINKTIEASMQKAPGKWCQVFA